MRAFSLRSGLCVLCAALILSMICRSSRAVEIHVVGDAAYKYVDGEWINTVPERMGSMTAIWAFSEDDIFIGNDDGAVFHFDGYDWKCIFVDANGRDVEDIWGTDITLTATETPSPKSALSQNHPNPFNPSTTISFSLRERGRASLAVYDVAGRLVRVLMDDVVEEGPHDVTWDGKDNTGRGVASGVYFYRLEAGEFIETKKMVLLR